MATETLEQPAPADAPEAPPSDAALFNDPSQAYGRLTFSSEKDEPEGETATPDAGEEPAPEASPPSPAAESTAPPDDDLTPEELARFERSSKAQERITQLANNVAGNKLQTERERIRREVEAELQDRDTKFEKASEYHNSLVDDEEFFKTEVGKHGRVAVMRWMADFEESAAARGKPGAAAPPVDMEAIRSEYAQEWNTQGAQVFADTLKSQPFYSELPQALRTKFEKGESDPNAAHWVADWMDGLGKWVTSLKTEHAKALHEARTAGKNEAQAEHEDTGPVVTSPTGPATDPAEIERRYGQGDPSISREDFKKALKAQGKDY